MTDADDRPEGTHDMDTNQTPISGDLPDDPAGAGPEPNSDLTEGSGITENTDDVQSYVGSVGDAGDLPVPPQDDPTPTLGESDETRPA